MKPTRIYADFNNKTAKGLPRLNTAGSLESIERIGEPLQDGQEVVLYEDEFEVNAVIRFEPDEGLWVGIPEWETLRYFSKGDSRK